MTKRLAIAAMIGCTVALAHASDGSWVFLVEPAFGVDMTSPGEDWYDLYGNVGLSVGVRGGLSAGEYYAITSRIEARIYDDLIAVDREHIHLKMRLNSVSFEAGLLASIMETDRNQRYIHPNWRLGADIPVAGDDGDLELAYDGFLFSIPTTNGDLFFEGIRVGYRADPSLSFGYRVEIGGGWEYYYEQPLYTDGGGLSPELRHDVLLDLSATFDGMLGYFTEWGLSGGVGWRSSTANYATVDYLLTSTEDRIVASAGAEIFSSPHRSWTLEGTFSFDQTWYLFNPVNDINGGFGTQKLQVLDLAAGVRIDWSPIQRMYLVLAADGAYSLSNDPFIGGWYLDVSAGVTLSL